MVLSIIAYRVDGCDGLICGIVSLNIWKEMKKRDFVLMIVVVVVVVGAGLVLFVMRDRDDGGDFIEEIIDGGDARVNPLSGGGQSGGEPCYDVEARFASAPVDVGSVSHVEPQGKMTGSHVTPVDHQYWSMDGATQESIGQIGADSLDPDRYAVLSPADGFVVSIGTVRNDGDYRVVIEHTCSVISIFIHIDSISDKLESAADWSEGGSQRYASMRVPVEAGEVIGGVGPHSFDFSVHDADVDLVGFITPSLYEAEPWKVHTVDPLEYFEGDVREAVLAKTLGNAQPRGGRIDFDLPGALVGNWFEEGSGGYGSNASEYWRTHLAVGYDSLDPSQVRVSIGDWDGGERQFAVLGNEPDPADVDETFGVVEYELVDWEYFDGSGNRWDRMSFAAGLRAEESIQSHGVVLFQVLGGEKLRAQFFPGARADDIDGFTDSAREYYR